jgi:bifunctional lysine-specific demethylase and histidyl-hydroxylase NO66
MKRLSKAERRKLKKKKRKIVEISSSSSSSSSSHSTLSSLIGGGNVDLFFKKTFQNEIFVVKRNDTTKSLFERLNFSSERIFKWIENSKLTYEKDITVTRVNQDGLRENFHEGETGAARFDMVVRKQFREEGCSLRLLCPQAHSPSIHRVLSELESEFEDFVSSNAYLTPGNTQGFAAHYDDIEAFVLQLEGKKEWTLYKPETEEEMLPRYSSPDFKIEDLGKPCRTVTLEPGDMLYFPRGFIHYAKTPKDCEHSLHLTVSTGQTNSYVDLMEIIQTEALRNAIESNVAMRRGLVRGLTSRIAGIRNEEKTDCEDRDSFLSNVRGMCDYVRDVSYNLVDAAVDQLARKRIRGRLPIEFPSKWKHDVTLSSTQTEVRLVRHDVLHLAIEQDEDGETIAVVYHCARNSCRFMEYPESRLEFDLCFAPLVETLLKSDSSSSSSFIKIETLVDKLVDVLKDWDDSLASMGRSVLQSKVRSEFVGLLLENGVVECR